MSGATIRRRCRHVIIGCEGGLLSSTKVIRSRSSQPATTNSGSRILQRFGVWLVLATTSVLLVVTAADADRRRPGYPSADVHETVESLVRQWAPMVWLAPGEQFMPGNVNDFLRNVHAEKSTVAAASVLHQTADILDVSDDVLLYELDREIGHSEEQQQHMPSSSAGATQQTVKEAVKMKTASWSSPIRVFERVIDLPIGKRSQDWFLTTNADVDTQLEDGTSFLYGQDPNRGRVPIYAVVNICDSLEDMFSENDIDYHDRTARTSYIPINNGASVAVPIPHRLKPPPLRKNMTTHESGVTPQLIRTKRGANNKTSPLALGSSFPINAPTMVTPITAQQNFSSVPIAVSGDQTPSKTVISDRIPQFHVTYWMFYPYNQGKTICTLNLGPLGRLPIPQLFGKCLGTRRDFGSHVGDWEHMTLYFRAGRRREPAEMYVSAHDAGAYYTYERLTGSFDFRRQETRNNHILQQPVFPKTVRTLADSHPVLFSARGSHGLWTAPGQHRFVRVPRLVDVNGFGTPWHTWKNIEFSYDQRQQHQRHQRNGRNAAAGNRRMAGGVTMMDGPDWLRYMGRWGNAKSKCHPLKRLGLNFCEYNDGPTGIPLKEPHFVCKR